jgi:hypothetical protein
MLSFFTVSNFYHFYVIILHCTYFVLSLMLSFLGCYHLCFHLILSFFTVSKCYHFYVIIWCSHTWSHPKNYTPEMITIADFYKKIPSAPWKMISLTPWKMILSSALENDNIQAFKNVNIYTWKMIISSTLENDNILAFKNDNI